MVVRIVQYAPDYDVIPQAIIWRPLRYFTVTIRDGHDGLDIFKAASFAIRNDITFDLRVYRAHPEFTVTLYLPEEVSDEGRITEIVDIVIEEMSIPSTAVAWRRGQDFQFGKLERQKQDRLRESEARMLVLKIASQQPGGTASTRFLKKEVPKYIELSSHDRARSKSRPSEEVWQQIVGNVISHDKTRVGPFAKGYAVKTADGLAVTAEGLSYLKSLGFLATSDSVIEA